MYAWDFISLIVFALIAYPIIRYIETLKHVYLIICIGIAFCIVFIKLTRLIPPYYSFMLRPNNAYNCCIMNKGGEYNGRIGFPSGHALIASYILTCLLLMKFSYIKCFFAIILITLIGLSRYYKHCHTPLQVIAGIILGVIFGWVTQKLTHF